MNLWSLEERRNRQDLIEVFKICKGLSRIRSEELFQFDNRGKGTRGHSLLMKVRCMRDSRRHFFLTELQKGGTNRTRRQSMRPALTHLKVNQTNFDILGWAFSWTSSLSPRPPDGIFASEAAQGE